MATVSLDALKDALSQVDFPAGKDDVIRSAQDRGASADALAALRSVPPVDYRNADEVIASITHDVGSEPVESVHADPANKPDTPGVSERLR